MTKVKEVEKSAVDNTVVEIRPIKRIGWLPADHDGAYKYTGTETFLTPSIEASTGQLRTGLSEEDERRLEKAMNLAVGSLNKYSDWWKNHKNFVCRIPKEGRVFDLKNPRHELEYKFLSSNHPKVCKSPTEVPDSPDADFVLTSPELDAKQENIKAKSEREAVKKFGTMSTEDKRNTLKVYAINNGQVTGRVPKNASEDFIEAQLYKRLKDSPDYFLSIVNNPSFNTLSFIDDCVSTRVIQKQGAKYITPGGDVIGLTLELAVEYLEDPRNQEFKLMLKEQLNHIK